MIFQSTREDLAPKTALDQLDQARSGEDVLHVLQNVIPHFVLAISKAKADDETKVEAIFYLGQIEDAFFALSRAFYTITMLRFHGFTEQRLLSFMKTHIAALINMYANIKHGKPLEDVVSELEYEATILRALIAEHIMFIDSEISNLREELRSVAAEA